MAQRFSFGNACLHFAQTEGPRGFIWKYLLAYVLGAILMTGTVFVLFRPLFNVWFGLVGDVFAGANEAEMEAIFVRRMTEIIGYAVLGYGTMLLLGLAYWAMFEAAVLRHYVRDEGFKLRLGADEFRLMVVGVIWFVCWVALNIMSFIFIGVVTSTLAFALDNDIFAGVAFFVSVLAVGVFSIWLAVRLAPAAAMTVRDRQISFFNAWGATRRRFWPLLGAYIVLSIGMWIVSAVIWPLVGTGIGAAIWANAARFERAIEDPIALIPAIMQFDILGPLLTGGVVLLLMQGFFVLVWAGPAALAAKTDPRGGGITQAPDAFA